MFMSVFVCVRMDCCAGAEWLWPTADVKARRCLSIRNGQSGSGNTMCSIMNCFPPTQVSMSFATSSAE